MASSFVANPRLMAGVRDEPKQMLQPISGYEEELLLPLEDACKPLEKILDNELKQNMIIAKENSAEPEDRLSQDESASIHLYTMEWKKSENSLYAVLNRALRTADRRILQPWFIFLKLFLTAFFKLAPTEYQTVWRGVPEDLSALYPEGKEFTWWGISSCTSAISVLESSQYAGTSGARTMFSIETNNGKLIRQHSYFQQEDEILLPPGIYLKVIDKFSSADGLHIIYLREISPPYKMLADPFDLSQWHHVLPQSKPSSHTSSSQKKQENYSISSVTPKSPVQVSAKKDLPNIPLNVRWTQNGVTIAAGHRQGNASNQLSCPYGLYVDDDRTVLIADHDNHRIVEWKPGATSSQVVAGGNGSGNRTDQLNQPLDVIVDKETDSLIISDKGNRRVMRWFRRSRTSGETIITNVDCWGLTMDDERFLYVSDPVKDEVRRYRVGETNGTVVAGGNGQGDRLNQLNGPRYVFVDRDHSVYVSDRWNHRVMRWCNGAKEGVVVAGGRGKGNALNQLWYPYGVFVDPLGTVYVADSGNHRVMRWCNGATQGNIIVGRNGRGQQANQLNGPVGLSFDRHDNLYVADCWNHRVQRFSIEKTN